ncbi:hypothetical protein LR48_Vigan09g078600 [Vigna angularis]|uniref:Uncharacterized protein n=1 Tax=Phaseolus angularis TaxID=3914 RepID=A0A0L9VB35_PHAAN|nr:hypothetical protein LR48_Vigan09g078600 [Vigna angularis]
MRGFEYNPTQPKHSQVFLSSLFFSRFKRNWDELEEELSCQELGTQKGQKEHQKRRLQKVAGCLGALFWGLGADCLAITLGALFWTLCAGLHCFTPKRTS